MNAPAGLPFSDGVRCLNGTIKRIQTSTSAGGTFTSIGSISAQSAALGDPIGTGSSRYYGVWYRDPCASFGCAATSNVSNGLAVRWGP